MARRDTAGDDLPIAVHPLSNGEYAPLPRSELVDEAVRRTFDEADANARRLGMSRRAFLRSASGMATMLLAISACSREQGASVNRSTSTSSTTTSPPTTRPSTTTLGPGGTFELPPESTIDEETATAVLEAANDDLVIDVQTHLLEVAPDEEFSWGLGFPQASCGADPRDCMGIDAWLDLVLAGSDTTVAVLSAIPVVADPDPLSAEVMERARAQADAIGCSDRVLMQGHATPTLGSLDDALAAMTATADRYDLAAWKAYTHEGPIWRLDDEVGTAFLDHVRSLGQSVVCVHKGLGPAAASPADVGPAAAAHPDLAICAYHSGFERSVTEGPYPGDDAVTDAHGVDRLIASVRRAGLGPGDNVYAELGSTWWNLIQRPDEAAHVLGKLLVALGPDNLLWGTDSLWYGSPQSQIEAFRAFTITPEYQERFGYPALTDDIKRKILGRNAAALYGVDPAVVACQPSVADRRALRSELPTPPTGPRTAAAARRTFADEHPWFRPHG